MDNHTRLGTWISKDLKKRLDEWASRRKMTQKEIINTALEEFLDATKIHYKDKKGLVCIVRRI